MTDSEFEQIYRTYFGRVYRYILGLSGNPDVAEEVTSDTFFKALSAIDRFRGDCDLNSWLCQIAKNSYHSHLRRCRHEEPVEQTPDFPGRAEPGPEELLVSESASMEIHAIVHRMAEPYKEVFLLRLFGQLSFRQIGALFGRSENWACVTYHRARKKIQDELEELK